MRVTHARRANETLRLTVTELDAPCQALADTGLDRPRVYDLRHSSATLGLAAGEEMKTVSGRLGHSTYKLTADTYSHVQDSMKRRSADAREALLADAC